MKARQDELAKARIQVEADMVVEKVQHVEVETVKSYAQDLRGLLEFCLLNPSVELRGFEPLVSAMRTRRFPS